MKLRALFPNTLLACAVALTASCRTRSYNALTKQGETDSRPGPIALDVNDVSILFPMPDKPDELANLVALSAKVGTSATELVPEGLFQDIVGKIAYTDESTKLKHKSGIRLEGKRSPLRLERRGPFGIETFAEGPFDFRDYAKWRIAALRYDPCVDLSGLKAPGKVSVRAFDKVETDACVAQLRLTAQPFIRAGEDQTKWQISGERDLEGRPMPIPERDPDHIVTADYALHLAFTLDHVESKRLAEELLAFKMACGNVTESMPLGVHPCLWRTARGKPVHSDAFGAVRRIIESHAHRLEFAAFMGTDLNTDPWVFFTGLVAGGAFKHVPIRAVRIPEGEKVAVSAKSGKPLPLPFNNGWYQMFTLLMANGQIADKDGAIGAPVVPVPSAGFVNDEISPLIVDRSRGNRGSQDKTLKKVLPVINPHKNNPLTTDCVSCHRSSSFVEEALSILASQRTSTEEKDELVGLYRNALPRRPGYTPIAALDSRQTNTYNVMNFAWFKGVSSVSHRTVIESVEAAHLANVSHLGLTPNKEGCDVLEVEMCMYREPGKINFLGLKTRVLNQRLDLSLAGLEVYDACRTKVCGKGLRADQKMASTRLVVTRDTVAKAKPWDPAKLDESIRCAVKEGATFPLAPNVAPVKEDGHLMVWALNGVPDIPGKPCSLIEGVRPIYFLVDDVRIE